VLDKQQLKLKRAATLAAVLSKFGFQNVLSKMGVKSQAGIPADATSDEALYARIRMSLEALGPTFVKLGQAFSNREDMLPKGLIRELQQLQDKVESSAWDLDAMLEYQFGAGYRQWFREIDPKPLAAASIAQVYRAVLSSGEQVVLKIKRPQIDDMIEGDLLIMKDLAQVLTSYFDFAERFNLLQAVNTFEKSLHKELSFVNERENMERFERNFKGNTAIYVPRIYPQLCNNDVLCMEYIEGAKPTNKAFFEQHQLNPSELARTGLELFLTQILEHGFFHADPHAGNILVLPDGKIVFIDMGAMGNIYKADQELLEDVILNILTKNAPKLVSALKKMAIRAEISNEKQLHDEISEILYMVDRSNLESLNMALMFNKFKDILFENRVIMPDYFTLLARGLVLIESVGRTLDPDMNIMTAIEPYVQKIIKKRLSIPYLFNRGLSKLADIGHDIQDVPVEMRHVLQLLNEGELTVNTRSKDQAQTNAVIRSSATVIVLGLLLAAHIVATTLLIVVDKGPYWLGLPALALVSIVVSGVLTVVLLLKMVRK
jgi:ubiquinone biosynthesis protein